MVEPERTGRREARAENRFRRTVWGPEVGGGAAFVLVVLKLASRDWWRRVVIVGFWIYINSKGSGGVVGRLMKRERERDWQVGEIMKLRSSISRRCKKL